MQSDGSARQDDPFSTVEMGAHNDDVLEATARLHFFGGSESDIWPNGAKDSQGSD
jgi:hypothetical protein